MLFYVFWLKMKTLWSFLLPGQRCLLCCAAVQCKNDNPSHPPTLWALKPNPSGGFGYVHPTRGHLATTFCYNSSREVFWTLEGCQSANVGRNIKLLDNKSIFCPSPCSCTPILLHFTGFNLFLFWCNCILK